MKKLLIFLLPLLTFFACNNNGGSTNGAYEISGKVKGAGGIPLYLDRLSFDNNERIDTAIISNDGSFVMKGTAPEKGLYILRLENGLSWAIMLEGGKLSIDANVNDVMGYTIQGSPSSNVLNDFIKDIGSKQLAMRQLNQDFLQARMTGASVPELVQMKETYEGLQKAMNYNIKQFLDTVSNVEMAVYAAGMLDEASEMEYLQSFVNKIKGKSSESKLVAEYIARFQEATRLSVGGKAPEFSLKTPKGEEISLSSVKGKVVLLDFWASWCRPCRMENPNLVRTYNKYKDQGFTVFSISLDNNLQQWVSAINQDGLTWPYHGSELRRWQCSVSQMYKVTSIPATYLLSEDGTILAKNLRGVELEKKLEEIFGS